MAGLQNIRHRTDYRNDGQESIPLIPPDYIETKEKPSNSSSYISATILMFFLISIGIALSLIPIFTLAAGQNTDLSYQFVAIKIIRNLFSSVVTCTLLTFVKNKQKWVTQGYVWWPAKLKYLSGNVENNNIVTKEEQQHSSRHTTSLFWPVFILGIGSAIKDVIGIILKFYCIIVKGFELLTDSGILSLLNNIIYLIFEITQVLFFYVYDGAVFAGRSFFHYAMAFFIASNIWAWVGVTVSGPYWGHFGSSLYSNGTYTCSYDVSKVLYWLNAVKISIGIVFPEYSTIAVTIMCSYWSTMTSFPNVAKRNQSKDVNNERDFENSNQTHNASEESKQQRNMILFSFRKHYIVALFSFITVVLFFALNVVTQYGRPKIWASENIEKLSVISGLFSFAIVVTKIYLIIKCHDRVENSYITYESSLSSSDTLLVFAVTWSFLYDIIQIIASIDLIRSGKVILGVVGLLLSICVLIETSVQTRFFLTIQRIDMSKVRSQEFIRPSIILIMIMNAGYWVIVALAHEWVDGGIFAPLVSMSFDGNNVKIGSIIILTLFPMISLFRFHSMFICCEILKMMRNCEQPQLPDNESESNV